MVHDEGIIDAVIEAVFKSSFLADVA